MKKLFIGIFCVLAFASCKDHSDRTTGPDEPTPTPPEEVDNSDNEHIYQQQSDKGSILTSHIVFDDNTGKYILDLSEPDAISLGISKETYDDAVVVVGKMNELGLKLKE